MESNDKSLGERAGADLLSEQNGIHSLHHRLLELTLQQAPLDNVLTELVEALHAFIGADLACSILIADNQQARIFHGAAVGLSEAYTQAVDGIEVGPVAGSCGTAAFRKEAVLVADIANDPLWVDFRHLILPEGMKACWSNPIIGAEGAVLGSFAIYSPKVGLPDPKLMNFLELVSRTTALILERYAAQTTLSEQKRLLETLDRIGAGVAAELDLDTLVQMVTDAGVELTGAHFGAFFYNVVNESDESYMLYSLSGVERAAFADFPMPRNTAIFAPTFEGKGIVRSDDITLDPRYGKNGPNKGMPKGHLPVRSYLSVPVISRSGEVVGGLFFGHPETERFTEHHEFLMDGIANQAATAIDNARLYQTAQREIEVRRSTELELLKTQKDLEAAQERVKLALEAGAIIGTWIWYVPEDVITADERFALAFGLDPADCHEGLPLKEATLSIHPDEVELVEAAIGKTLKHGGRYSEEYRVRHADGNYRWVEANGHCQLDAEGQPLRFPGVLIDIEQRKQVEINLKWREADLALLLDATADGFYAVDTEGKTTRCNATFLRMLGFTSEADVIGKELHDIIHHSHVDGSHYPREQCPIYRVAQSGDLAHVDDEVFFRTDGTSFHVEYWVRPVIWEGELQGAVCNIVDISERKRAENARQLLLQELNHRIKNLFSITNGMIQMTARNSTDVKQMANALSGRLMSLARAHDLIATSITTKSSTAGPSRLRTLVETVMEPHVGSRSAALKMSGPEVSIGPSAMTSMALILHELATNAAKYGALSDPDGSVSVRWELSDEALTLSWKEAGGPQVVGAPDREGFGSQLARLSAKGQLGGAIEYIWETAGVEILLTVAADRVGR